VGDFPLTTVDGTKTVTYPDVLVKKTGTYSVTETDATAAFTRNSRVLRRR
jgi:hypothetical protein